jgi:hypothetical protein
VFAFRRFSSEREGARRAKNGLNVYDMHHFIFSAFHFLFFEFQSKRSALKQCPEKESFDYLSVTSI